MPTYNNTSQINHIIGATILYAGAVNFSTRELFDGMSGVTRVSDEPYAYVDADITLIELLAANTAASTSEGVSCRNEGKLSFAVDGTLAAGEEIAIEYQAASGDWYALVESGLAVVLSADNNVVATDKPGVYRANKPLTVAAAGVTVCR